MTRELPNLRNCIASCMTGAVLISVLLLPAEVSAQSREALLDHLGLLNQEVGQLQERGQYRKAAPLAKDLVYLSEQAFGPDHPAVAMSLSIQARLLQAIGDYSKAQPLYERALRIQERALGKEHLDVAGRLGNLARLLRLQGDYNGARPLAERALKINERVLGAEHPAVAISLNDLAAILHSQGDYPGARPLFERALRINEQALGPEHPQVAVSLLPLAAELWVLGDSVGARSLWERSLKIRERALGLQHPYVAQDLAFLGLLLLDSGEPIRAAGLFQRTLQITERQTDRELSGLAERQKLLFLRMTDHYTALYLSLPTSIVPAAEAYAAVLARKNLAFRVLADERAALAGTADAATRALLEKRKRLIQDLTGLMHESSSLSKATWPERVAEVEKELDRIEADLSRTSTAFRQAQAEAKAGPVEICHALPGSSVLLDFFRYLRYSPRQGSQPGRWTDSYTVFVLRGGNCSDVQRFELGSAEPIDRAAKAFRESLTGSRKVDGKDEPLPEAEIISKAQALGSLILPPRVRAAIAGASTLLVAPDGPLALIPFKLLPGDEGHPFLLETHTVATIPSGRDVLRLLRKMDPSKPATQGLVLVGNPDYGATVGKAEGVGAGTRAMSRAGCVLETAAAFDPLPGTAEEVRAIAADASAHLKGATLHRAEGHVATEAWLSQQMAGQRYVHLATHGYFAGDGCTPPSLPASRGVIVQAGLRDEFSGPVGTNPLLLSGIALAGANHRAQAQSGADDGILTALEVTGLDLQGTDLVVLSACETALGKQQAGQELLGLRWAFGMAGARSLLTSLWKVPDEPTVRLMTKFYGYLWRSPKDGGPLGKAAALRQAQLDLINENRARFNGDSRPNDWGSWVLSGDWR